ncbi:MAG: class I SAM-dependent methyltransferase [Thermoanaerobaculia bacterium]
MNREELQRRKQEFVDRHGSWTAHTIHLGGGVYTDHDPDRLDGNSRLIRRITQATLDLAGKPLDQVRALDLACLEGQYGIELARHGADVVGIEIRETHIAKARFAAEALKLSRYEVRQDDVRNLSVETYGLFDVVLCIGILYHLDAPDVFEVIRRMASVCTRLLIIDTHVSQWVDSGLTFEGKSYRGRRVFEHLSWTTKEQRASKPWASIDNASSVWLSRASLDNALQDAGFTSVFACDVPALPGRRPDRQTIIALKGAPAELHCTPAESGAPLLRSDEKSVMGSLGGFASRLYSVARGKVERLRRDRR